LPILLIIKNKPLIKPCDFKDSIAYSEHVGANRQFEPSIGDIIS